MPPTARADDREGGTVRVLRQITSRKSNERLCDLTGFRRQASEMHLAPIPADGGGAAHLPNLPRTNSRYAH